MLVYSKSTLSFVSLLKKYVREILRDEVGVKVFKNRFQYKGFLYPFHIVVFEKRNTLGTFDHHTYQIGINKNLMYSAKTEVIKNILRHELAHYFAYLETGEGIYPHGKEFRSICKKFGWDEEVYSAVGNLDHMNDKVEGDFPSENVIAKVKKLLSLAKSSNIHEAELATLKANQLILQHNLKRLGEDDDTTYLKRVLSGKRNNGKYRAIYEILRSFMVQPVFNYGKGIFYLEVIGERDNVEMAEYVAHFLDFELELLWQKYRENHRGINAKNSFMKGVCESFVEKIAEEKREHYSKAALVKMDKSLKNRVKMAYPRLSGVSSTRVDVSQEAKTLGKKAGADLSIRKGLKNRSKLGLFLPKI
ncbi:MAG: hypothetical protein DRQ88_10330 [Epsilonproteobacteria bacterium]|nr:MAG: hypothetical protein DRQ88_10330 [Campylobacterota bacterium]RLA65371.1 MAG: hypothetical protein DRQ89_01230 [Campylobacterota bacterium]